MWLLTLQPSGLAIQIPRRRFFSIIRGADQSGSNNAAMGTYFGLKIEENKHDKRGTDVTWLQNRSGSDAKLFI